MPWHVVHTNAGREAFAADELRRRGYPVLFLHYVARTRHARRDGTTVRSRFPRYIFAAVEDGLSFYGINTTPGVSTVLHGPKGPIALSDAVMDELRAMGNEDGLCVAPTPEERVRWKEGDVIRVTRGPFEGFLATVGVDSGVALKIWMDLFGRPTEAEIAPDWVEPASPELRSNPKAPARRR